MEIGKLITGFVFLALGGLNTVKPEIYINYQVWIFKNVYGAEFKPSAKTIKINKFMGVVFVLMGLLILVN